MKRTDIDRWTAKRLRQIPSLKGFIIRRGERHVESFSPAEASEVSAFCKPGDVILAIMPDDTVGLTCEVESDGVDAAQAGVSGAVLRVVGEQIGRANEGVTAGYEGLIASYREELRYSRERIKELERQVSELQTNNNEVVDGVPAAPHEARSALGDRR